MYSKWKCKMCGGSNYNNKDVYSVENCKECGFPKFGF
jgi:ribosomal protein L37E